jgi:hypothetical protein
MEIILLLPMEYSPKPCTIDLEIGLYKGWCNTNREPLRVGVA